MAITGGRPRGAHGLSCGALGAGWDGRRRLVGVEQGPAAAMGGGGDAPTALGGGGQA